jgi:2-phospho-L-lactate/phosphoenolpyruvate guanylyltransferase
MTATWPIWGVVPIKGFARAKQRLATALSPGFREALATTMVEDVLAALAGSARLQGILVVTGDGDAAEAGRRHGAEIFSVAEAGHTAAVTAAGLALAGRSRGMLSIPGDVPGTSADEIDALIAGHGAGRAFSIVPAHDGRGSNAILATPPDVVALAYGDDSFLPHLAAARRAGLEPTVRRFEGIGLDVDTPEDLLALYRKGWATRTQRFLAGSAEFSGFLAGRRTVAADEPGR